jgi:hypothetical protein
MAVAIFIYKVGRMQVDFSFFRNFNVRLQTDSEPVVQKPLGKRYAVMFSVIRAGIRVIGGSLPARM